MSIINPMSIEKAQSPTKETLLAVKDKMEGALPNFFGIIANAPAALHGFLALSDALAEGKLSAKHRAAISIAVANRNSCDYCLAVHTSHGQKAGLDANDLMLAKTGKSSDPRTQAILDLAIELNKAHGRNAGAAASKARAAGLSEEEMIEVAANVAMSVMTNSVNGLAETEVDFPKVAVNHAA